MFISKDNSEMPKVTECSEITYTAGTYGTVQAGGYRFGVKIVSNTKNYLFCQMLKYPQYLTRCYRAHFIPRGSVQSLSQLEAQINFYENVRRKYVNPVLHESLDFVAPETPSAKKPN